MVKSIYQQAKELGIPIDHHESDLYLKVTPESMELIKNYQFKANVHMFTADDGTSRWYDIPFAFDPFWEKCNKQNL